MGSSVSNLNDQGRVVLGNGDEESIKRGGIVCCHGKNMDGTVYKVVQLELIWQHLNGSVIPLFELVMPVCAIGVMIACVDLEMI